jgi:hypothetical protein
MKYLRVTTDEGKHWVLSYPDAGNLLEFVAEFESREKADAYARWQNSFVSHNVPVETVSRETVASVRGANQHVHADAMPELKSSPATAPEPVDFGDGEYMGVRLTGQQRAIIETLTTAADENGCIMMSFSEIAAKSGVPQGSVSAILDMLAKKNFIAVARPGGRGITTTYQVLRRPDPVETENADVED